MILKKLFSKVFALCKPTKILTPIEVVEAITRKPK